MPTLVDDNTRSIEVETLVADVKAGKVALPEFQRDFVWDEDDVAALLVSIARGWPTGTFLLLSGEQVAEFQAKAVEGAPEIDESSIETLVLDGQQRLTGLYHAFEDSSDYVYYLEIGQVRAAGTFDDENVKAQKRHAFTKLYPDVEAEASARIIKIHRIIDNQRFADWSQFLPKDERAGWFEFRDSLLPGLKSYGIPSVNLTRGLPLQAVAKIFETINNTGQSLTTFDLMVARLYPHKFRLKDRWTEACDMYPEAMEDPENVPKKYRGDRISGIDILKLIALWETIQLSGTKSNAPRGVRESDVLLLSERSVIDNWDRACASLDRAIRFVKEHCGVARWNLLPSKVMLFPIADALTKGDPDPDLTEKLKRWFWGATMKSLYATSTSTQPISDTDELRKWLTDSSQTPGALQDLPSDESFLEQLLEERPKKVLLRGIASLMCARGARDWVRPARPFDGSKAIELHHIFPTDFNKVHSLNSANVLANLTPILSTTNKSLRSDAPSQVVDRVDVEHSALESHLIDVEAYAAEHYEEFLGKRSQAILAALKQEVAGK